MCALWDFPRLFALFVKENKGNYKMLVQMGMQSKSGESKIRFIREAFLLLLFNVSSESSLRNIRSPYLNNCNKNEKVTCFYNL